MANFSKKELISRAKDCMYQATDLCEKHLAKGTDEYIAELRGEARAYLKMADCEGDYIDLFNKVIEDYKWVRGY